MTVPANTFVSTAAIGNREDLSNTIYRIAPTDTPFMSMIAKGTADATKHEWQTQALATAANNAQVEGDDAAAVVVTPTVRLFNNTQISSKTASVSGTQEEVKKAGRTSEMAYQMSLKSLELKNDIEFGLTQNSVLAASPRQSRGLPGWMDAANVNAGAGYVAPNYVTNVAQTDGTQIAFTEARLKDVLQKVYTAGGRPDTIMLGPTPKQTFSTFTGNSTRMDNGEDKKVVAATDIYVSDFGTLKAVVNRRQRQRDGWVLQSDMWSLDYLRGFRTKDLAVTGDSMRKQIICEYSLQCSNPAANGGVLDIL